MTARSKRERRGSSPSGAYVTPRDILAFDRLLSRFSSVRTSHIARFWGASSGVVTRRGRRWRDLGYVAVKTTAMHEENRYQITRRGRELLDRVCGPREWPTGRTGRVASGVHHDAGIDLYIDVMIACARCKRSDPRLSC